MGKDYEFKYNNDFTLSPFCAISEYKFNELNQREQTLIMELEQNQNLWKSNIIVIDFLHFLKYYIYIKYIYLYILKV